MPDGADAKRFESKRTCSVFEVGRPVIQEQLPYDLAEISGVDHGFWNLTKYMVCDQLQKRVERTIHNKK